MPLRKNVETQANYQFKMHNGVVSDPDSGSDLDSISEDLLFGTPWYVR